MFFKNFLSFVKNLTFKKRFRMSRREELVLCRPRIRHSRLPHELRTPLCTICDEALTVKQEALSFDVLRDENQCRLTFFSQEIRSFLQDTDVLSMRILR